MFVSHGVIARQTRSVVDVGAVLSYSVPEHLVVMLHTRSEVDVPVCDSYSTPEEQTVKEEH